ncbi:MAG TPA: HlyD family efflux transporter periplasmic adaptor subunit [Tepidisphaeraceae bacterium]
MTRFQKWTLAIVVVGGAAVIFFTIHLHAKSADAAPPTTEPAKTEKKTPPGHLKLKPEEIEHTGIKSESLEGATFTPEIKLYGVLQEDPESSFTLRAPAAGTLVASPEKPWPALGQTIAGKTTIGQIQQRLAPADQIALAAQQLTLQTQLATAQADASSANITLAAATTSYERLKALNAQEKNVSDRVVEEALTKVKTEQAHVEAANRTVELVKAAIASPQMKAGALPLEVERAGEVVEVLARPGESLESGLPILRVVDFHHVLASVYAHPGEDLPPSIKQATITPLGFEGKPLTGVFVGIAAAVDPKSHQRALLFKIDIGEAMPSVRPGAPIVASVSAEGEPLKGVNVPKSAVVRYLGKAWVYVVASDGGFDRKEISLDHPIPDAAGWFVIESVKPGDRIVVTGAAALLSQEINAAFGGGAAD